METECIKNTVIVNTIVRSDISLRLVRSGSQPDDDPHGVETCS